MDKNMLVLAYLGDSIYETYIRKYLISIGICKVKELQEKSVKYVGAKGQAYYLKKMVDNNFFSDEELNVIKCARNHKNNHKPKNCDIITYKYATGLEALIGYLYYKNEITRIEKIMNYIINSENNQ